MSWFKIIMPRLVMAGVNGKTTVSLFSISSKNQVERVNAASGGHSSFGNWPALDPGSL